MSVENAMESEPRPLTWPFEPASALSRPVHVRNAIVKALTVVLASVNAACSDPDGDAVGTSWPDWSAPVMSIGALDQPISEVFGSIDDVEVAADGTIAVLDGQAAAVSVFDSTGQFKARLGGPGDGPAELRNPLSLVLANHREVLVGQLTRTWKVFGLDSPDGGEPETIRLIVSPRDMCRLTGGIAVHGVVPEEESVLWVYSLGGESRDAFGTKAQGANDLVRVTNSYGRIACARDGGQVVYMPTAADSTMRSFRADGSPAWTATISGYLSPIVTETDGGYTVQMPETGWHSVVSLLPWTDDAFIVQIAYHTLESRELEARWETLQTYVIDAATGAVTPGPDDVPELSAVGDRWVIGVAEMPYPRLIVWER